MRRDCPWFRSGVSQKGIEAMILVPVTTPLVQPTRGGGHTIRGRHKGGVEVGGGQARCYAFSGMPKAAASDTVIVCIISVCHRDISVSFELGSTYSYMSSYFASYLSSTHDSLDIHVYIFTLVGDSTMVDRVCRSCVVTINGYDMMVDLLLLDMVDFEVILSMDWLSLHLAILDYQSNTMTLDMPEVPPMGLVPAVREFLEVFPMDLSVLMLPRGSGPYTVYYDASRIGLGALLMHEDSVIANAS
ncbi:uncharacterized protein [Nicotiana tomentosiformis]|uniref:uncharacterized protein n=1 Tax=Nicotiana tomentosiformis TaxID=4098 RepID=UPI00388C5058